MSSNPLVNNLLDRLDTTAHQAVAVPNPGTKRENSNTPGQVLDTNVARNSINQLRNPSSVASTVGIPKHVSNVAVRTIISGTTTNFAVSWTRDASDKNYQAANIHVTGYNGSTSPQRILTNATGPAVFNLASTNEPITITVQATGNKGSADLSTAPTMPTVAGKPKFGGYGYNASPAPSTLDKLPDGNNYIRVAAVNSYHLLGSKGQVSSTNSGITTSASSVLTQSGTSKTINVAAFTVQYPFGQVAYNSGTVTPAAYGAFVVYFADPTFAGGAVTFHATGTGYVANSNDNNQIVGVLTTSSAGGGQGGGGGGSGQICFSPDTHVKTGRGNVRFDAVKPGDTVKTKRGTWRPVLSVLAQPFDGEMLNHGNGLVTPGHKLWDANFWISANEFGFPKVQFTGLVYNLSVDATHEDEHSYTLSNGIIAHNYLAC